MSQTVDVNLMALAGGEHRVSELEDVETLMRLYKAKVLRFVAFSLGDRDTVESITQDCFLKAHATRALFRGDCSVSTWLMRIAFNLVKDHTKSLKFRFWKAVATSAVDIYDVSHYVPSQGSSPEAQVLAREKVRMIQRSLTELSPKQRSVFVMRFVEELDLREIAEVTGMPVQTVKTHLYRAVAEIRSKFGASV
jgi:RNA polymerase sigma-70 factor (ECF subfamily)